MKTSRNKNDGLPKSFGLRQAPFAFRRIHARELYEPSGENEGHSRVKFRVRLYQPGRTEF